MQCVVAVCLHQFELEGKHISRANSDLSLTCYIVGMNLSVLLVLVTCQDVGKNVLV